MNHATVDSEDGEGDVRRTRGVALEYAGYKVQRSRKVKERKRQLVAEQGPAVDPPRDASSILGVPVSGSTDLIRSAGADPNG